MPKRNVIDIFHDVEQRIVQENPFGADYLNFCREMMEAIKDEKDDAALQAIIGSYIDTYKNRSFSPWLQKLLDETDIILVQDSQGSYNYNLLVEEQQAAFLKRLKEEIPKHVPNDFSKLSFPILSSAANKVDKDYEAYYIDAAKIITVGPGPQLSSFSAAGRIISQKQPSNDGVDQFFNFLYNNNISMLIELGTPAADFADCLQVSQSKPYDLEKKKRKHKEHNVKFNQLSLTAKATEEIKTIKIMRFNTPDAQAIEFDINRYHEFELILKHYQDAKKHGGHLFIHCSRGTGRTGALTFMLNSYLAIAENNDLVARLQQLHTLLVNDEPLDANKMADTSDLLFTFFNEQLRTIRQQRMLVQTPAQAISVIKQLVIFSPHLTDQPYEAYVDLFNEQLGLTIKSEEALTAIKIKSLSGKVTSGSPPLHRLNVSSSSSSRNLLNPHLLLTPHMSQTDENDKSKEQQVGRTFYKLGGSFKKG